jgi:hypothetical protein
MYLGWTNNLKQRNMAEVILFNISTKNQHVCSTFARHTRAKTQKPTLQKSCKHNIIQHLSGNLLSKQTVQNFVANSFCLAKTPLAHPPPKIQTAATVILNTLDKTNKLFLSTHFYQTNLIYLVIK